MEQGFAPATVRTASTRKHAVRFRRSGRKIGYLPARLLCVQSELPLLLMGLGVEAPLIDRFRREPEEITEAAPWVYIAAYRSRSTTSATERNAVESRMYR